VDDVVEEIGERGEQFFAEFVFYRDVRLEVERGDVIDMLDVKTRL